MKKPLGFALVLALAAAIGAFWFIRTAPNASGPELSSSDLTIRSIPNDSETDYAVRFAVHFQRSGAPMREVTNLEGVLTQVSRSDGEFVSEWKRIDQYAVDGKPVDPSLKASLLGKPSLTVRDGEGLKHLVAKDFPSQTLRTLLMILDRVFTPDLGGASPVLREELDDLVPFQAEYSQGKEGDLTVVRKKWVSFSNPASAVDAKRNTIVYYFDAQQHLLAAQGQLNSIFKEQGESELSIDFSIRSLESRPASQRLRSVARDGLDLADRARIADSDKQTRAANALSFEDAMKELNGVQESTDGEKFYGIFRALTDQVRANPEYAKVLAKRILELKERDPGSRRKLSAMFGALAESQSAEGADTLAELAKDCPDNYCKVQALMGINTHSKPSGSNLPTLLEIGRTSSDKEVAATALIAAGAVGRKMEGDSPELSRDLVATYNDPAKADLKTSVLAAMGNHGSADYWSTLSTGLSSSDSSIRAASVYSLRYLPQPEVNKALIDVIDKESFSSVILEAIKASGYRKFSSEEYTHIAQKAATFKNKELAEQAANLLSEVNRSRPGTAQEALTTLRDGTKYPEVKTFIEGQLRSTEAAKPQ